jgi:hypothetical protein
MLRRCFHRFIAILRAGRVCGRRDLILKHKKIASKTGAKAMRRQPAEVEKPESTPYLARPRLMTSGGGRLCGRCQRAYPGGRQASHNACILCGPLSLTTAIKSTSNKEKAV